MHDLSDSEKLLEGSWDERGQRLPRRDLLLEFALTAVVVLRLGPPCSSSRRRVRRSASGRGLAVALYAVATRIAFPIGGAGHAIPTQLLLIPLFALAPPAAVPGARAARPVARLAPASCLRGGQHPERMLIVGGDAAPRRRPRARPRPRRRHRLRDATWPLLLGALAASSSSTSSSPPCASGSPPACGRKLYFGVPLQIWAVDLSLSPLGLFAALLVASAPWAPLTIAAAARAARLRDQGPPRAHRARPRPPRGARARAASPPRRGPPRRRGVRREPRPRRRPRASPSAPRSRPSTPRPAAPAPLPRPAASCAAAPPSTSRSSAQSILAAAEQLAARAATPPCR